MAANLGEGRKMQEQMMTVMDDQEIRTRAHQLWEQAGRPSGRDAEFWLEAERQIKEERVRHELKTPDNL
ncbi:MULTISPECIES: DUF2934 domain-containing protein [unclassified Bradyrhizobium]|uniref:DUF2934 domain-containing protein n=1 Tax=unclassified Bradyrhizobium TaxID=2631580 RepID=UPI0028F12655|nr:MULTISPECIES: DUF2934 domain-containing protein [unclassified Bradyrhizobium]